MILLIFLTLDLLISIYLIFAMEDEYQRIISVVLDAGEIVFRILGVYFVGRFITDLHCLFAAPMAHSTSSTPAMPRSTRSSSMFVRALSMDAAHPDQDPNDPVIHGNINEV